MHAINHIHIRFNRFNVKGDCCGEQLSGTQLDASRAQSGLLHSKLIASLKLTDLYITSFDATKTIFHGSLSVVKQTKQ